MAKTVLIMGGTKGLGLSLAWEAHRREVHPIIAGRSVEAESAKFPSNADWFGLNLIDPASVEEIPYRVLEPLDYVFWVAGIAIFPKRSLADTSSKQLESMIATHLSGPVRALQLIHSALRSEYKHPYHLVTIASTSSWRMRDNETLYCMLKAAKATFARHFARELVRDLPGSKVTLVNPGGIKTPDFWKYSGQDISNFMEPNSVAKIIWDEVQGQDAPFKEVQIMRNDDGSPNVSYGPRMPELPFETGV